MSTALLTVKDAAGHLSVSEREVRRLSSIGLLERRYIGDGRRFYRITAASIDTYVESLPTEPIAEVAR